MKPVMRNILSGLLLALSCSTLVRSQGLYWESKDSFGRNGGQEKTSQYYAMPGMFKVVQGEDRMMILRLDSGWIISVNNAKKTYSVITFDSLEAMMKNLQSRRMQMTDEMKQRLANLPPEQRQMVEGMMNHNRDNSADTNFSVEKTNDTDEIAGYKAARYTVKHGDEDFATVWASSSVPGADALREDLKNFRDKLASLQPGGGGSMGRWMKTIEGFPLKTETQFSTSEVTKVEKKDTPASAFTVPDGYAKVPWQEMNPGQMRGRRPRQNDTPPDEDNGNKNNDDKEH